MVLEKIAIFLAKFQKWYIIYVYINNKKEDKKWN